MQNYFETDYVTIGYDKDNHIIVHRWIVAPTSAELREGANMTISAMKQFKTGKVVWDTRNMGTLHPDDQHWAATEYYNNARKAGYSQAAFIIPSDIFTQMSVEDTMSQVENIFLSAYFDNMESAEEWIKQADKPVNGPAR